MYRVYNSNQSVEVKQFLVPKDFRDHKMKLAHESIVGGHLGVRKTADRITSSFQWTRVMSDVTLGRPQQWLRWTHVHNGAQSKGNCGRTSGREPLVSEITVSAQTTPMGSY